MKATIELTAADLNAVLLDGTLAALGQTLEKVQKGHVEREAIISTQKGHEKRAAGKPKEAPENPVEKAKERSEKTTVEAPKEYKLADLQKAAVELARSGKRDVIASIIHDLGHESLTQLEESEYAAFAQKIVEAGGSI